MMNIIQSKPPKPRLRAVRRYVHRLLRSKVVQIDGVRVRTDLDIINRAERRRLYSGTYELPERLLMKSILRSHHRVLDIGTGLGLVSLIAARIVGGEQLLCYEANPALESVIKNNFALNNMHLNLRMKAITKNGAPVKFYANRYFIASSVYPPPPPPHACGSVVQCKEIMVASESLQHVVDEFGPTVVVMDMEGAEVDVLPAARLDEVEYLVVELHENTVGKRKIDALLRHLRGARFQLVRHIDNSVVFHRA